MKKIIVTGAGGFIGYHLTNKLVEDGHYVFGVDLKKPEFSPTKANQFFIRDLRFEGLADILDEGEIDEVYHLAADMGGIGFITESLAAVARNNTQIHLQVLESIRKFGRKDIKLCFSSTACVLARYKQNTPDVSPLTETDDFPYDPEPGYGFEKLYMEQLLEYYRKDFGLDSRIVRFHNCYGVDGAWRGGREKAPAAVCRKIAEMPQEGEVSIWGDGKCTRSFMHVDDCVEGLIRIMASNYPHPLNLGRDEMISVDGLYDLVADIAGKKILYKHHDLGKPQGVRGRNADCTRLKNIVGWVPQIDLRTGLARTYPWIAAQVEASQKDVATQS